MNAIGLVAFAVVVTATLTGVRGGSLSDLLLAPGVVLVLRLGALRYGWRLPTA